MINFTSVMLVNKKFRGILSLTLCTVIWGSAFVAQSVGMDYIGPFTFQTVRCFLALIGLTFLIGIGDAFKKDGKRFFLRWCEPQLWKAGVLCGIPLFLATNLQQIALVDTDAGKSAFLTAMYIVIVPLFGLFMKKKLSHWMPFSIVLAVAGLYCLSCIGVPSILPGDLLLLGCALMFAVQITVVDKYASHVDCLRLNFIQVLVCFLLSAIPMFLTESPKWDMVWASRLPLCYAGFLSMGIAYFLQILGQKDLPPTAASLLMSLESVFAVILGWLILGESLTKWELTGCILLFIAVILSQLPDKKNRTA